MRFTEKVLSVIDGVVIQGARNFDLEHVSIDTRVLKAKSIFVAIQGDRFDGHDFVDEAVAKGAEVVIVEKSVSCPKHISVIHVSDTIKALGQIARFHRSQFDIPVIAITGSAGKTTTKDLLTTVLGSAFDVLCNIKTENNAIGVPLTLLRLNEKHDMAVLELGTNHPGEIAWLAQIVRPTIGILTNVGASHIQGLKSLEGVFEEKMQLVAAVSVPGDIFFNQDDTYWSRLRKRKLPQKKAGYGLTRNADLQAYDVVLNADQLSFKIKGQEFRLKTPARHNVYNALAAVSCGILFNMSLVSCAAALETCHFEAGRQEVWRINGVTVVNDAYNANPISFASAIETLNQYSVPGRKILVCGDMLELGSKAREEHEFLAGQILSSEAACVLTFGDLTRYIFEDIKSQKEAYHYQTIESMKQDLKAMIRSGDMLMLKGSRCMRLERVLDIFKNEGRHVAYV